MKEILTQLIAAAIDAEKIPGLDCFDMTRRPRGQFDIVLSDTTRIRITVEGVPEVLDLHVEYLRSGLEDVMTFEEYVNRNQHESN